MIYEKFYYPKWYAHHLKENAYFYKVMVQYKNPIILFYALQTWSSVLMILKKYMLANVYFTDIN